MLSTCETVSDESESHILQKLEEYTRPVMGGCGVLASVLIILILSGFDAAPTPRSLPNVSGETRGLEVPTDLVHGIGIGRSSVQLVVNIHTDSNGYIEVQTN